MDMTDDFIHTSLYCRGGGGGKGAKAVRHDRNFCNFFNLNNFTVSNKA